MSGVQRWWGHWGECCGCKEGCVSGGCPNATYEATPGGSQTKKGHGGPCAFWDLQGSPGGWGDLLLTFLHQTTGNSFGAGTGMPLLPNKVPAVTAVVPVTEGASGTPAYDHPKKGACQYLCYVEDGGGNIHSGPGDDSYVKMTRKSDGSIELIVKFQPTSGPHWTDQKTGTGSIANHFVSGKTYNKDTSSWDDFGGTSGSHYSNETKTFRANIKTKLSSAYKGCCGETYGNNNLGGEGGNTSGGAAH